MRWNVLTLSFSISLPWSAGHSDKFTVWIKELRPRIHVSFSLMNIDGKYNFFKNNNWVGRELSSLISCGQHLLSSACCIPLYSLFWDSLTFSSHHMTNIIEISIQKYFFKTRRNFIFLRYILSRMPLSQPPWINMVLRKLPSILQWHIQSFHDVLSPPAARSSLFSFAIHSAFHYQPLQTIVSLDMAELSQLLDQVKFGQPWIL